MLPSSLEVAQSLRGSWRLMDEGEQALKDFNISSDGFVKSFAAIILTAPAFIAILAAERLRSGYANEAGLFTAPELALHALALHAISFVILPAIILGLFWGIARTARGTGFIITWNWTEVIITMLLAVPAALYAAGLFDGRMAFVVTLAFWVIAARLRYGVARSALGIARPLAFGVVLLTVAVEVAAAWTFAMGRF